MSEESQAEGPVTVRMGGQEYQFDQERISLKQAVVFKMAYGWNLEDYYKAMEDTDPRALEVWMTLLRAKTPGERIAIAFNLTEFALKMSESGVRARYPGASEREIFLRCAALRIPRELMIRAYGWDPEQPMPPTE